MASNVPGTIQPTPISITDPFQLESLISQFAVYNGRLIGQILIAMGVTDEVEISSIVENQVTQGKRGSRVGEQLLQRGAINKVELQIALAAQAGKPVIDITRFPITSKLNDLITSDLMAASRSVPLLWKDGELFVAKECHTDDLFDPQLRAKTQSRITSISCTKASIERVITSDAARSKPSESTLYQSDGHGSSSVETDPTWTGTKKLVQLALKKGATDIHFQPQAGDYRVRLRIHGELHDHERQSVPDVTKRLAQLKALAGMDTTSVERSQEGKIALASNDSSIGIRISTIPTAFGESMTMRLLDRSRLTHRLDDFGYSNGDAAHIESLMNKRSGLILIAGPTGSGKTSTIYAGLQVWAKKGLNVLTVEDPVEYPIEGIQQVEIDEPRGRTYPAILKNFLRHDPDCCMIGEIRDEETAQMATRAALTGRVVISSLHANDVPSALERLSDLNVALPTLISSLGGIIAQRLVPKLCDGCKVHHRDSVYYARGEGCHECAGIGHSGRVLIYEMLIPDDDLKSRLRAKGSLDEVRSYISKEHMVTMEHRAIEHAVSGTISFQTLQEFLSGDYSCNNPMHTQGSADTVIPKHKKAP